MRQLRFGSACSRVAFVPAVRFVFLPVMVLWGFWMWKGHVLRKLISKRSAQQDAADNPWPPRRRLHTKWAIAMQMRLWHLHEESEINELPKIQFS